MGNRANASRKLEISAFLQSYRPFKEKLDDMMIAESMAIEQLTQDAVQGEKLNELNKHILQKRAITMVYGMIEEMREDLHPSELSADAE